MITLRSGCLIRQFFQQRFNINKHCQEKFIALTFDDGPHPVYTPQLLDVLNKYQVTATFFLIGQHVQKQPDLTQRIFNEGHVIGNHSWSHRLLIWKSQRFLLNEIRQTQQIIYQVTQKQPEIFRAPYGIFGGHLLALLDKEKLTPIFWSTSMFDWRQSNLAVLRKRFYKGLKQGAVYLMHDGVITSKSASRQHVVELMEMVIPEALAQGYQFVSVQKQLAKFSHKEE